MQSLRNRAFLTLLIASAACSSCSAYRRFNPDLDREVAGPVKLSPEWSEVVPGEPLRPEREIHEIIIYFPNPYATNREGAQAFPDTTPGVQLVDQSGEVYNLSVSGRDATAVAYSFRDAAHQEVLPRDRSYRAIRLRSDKPVTAERLIWRCYNPWDHK